GSKSGKRRKSKKRRVPHDLTHPVPLVSESEHSSSPPRKLAGSGGKSTLGPLAVQADHPEEAAAFWCRCCPGFDLMRPCVVAVHGWFCFYILVYVWPVRDVCLAPVRALGCLIIFVSRWPCGHDKVAHHVLNDRLSYPVVSGIRVGGRWRPD